MDLCVRVSCGLPTRVAPRHGAHPHGRADAVRRLPLPPRWLTRPSPVTAAGAATAAGGGGGGLTRAAGGPLSPVGAAPPPPLAASRRWWLRAPRAAAAGASAAGGRRRRARRGGDGRRPPAAGRGASAAICQCSDHGRWCASRARGGGWVCGRRWGVAACAVGGGRRAPPRRVAGAAARRGAWAGGPSRMPPLRSAWEDTDGVGCGG